MNRAIRNAIGAALALACFVVGLVVAAPCAAQPAPAQPFAPEWGMLAGWEVFAEKGCGRCHALRGVGGGVGPDLGRIDTGRGFFEIGAAMWNHLPRMGARMRATGIERPTLSPGDVSNLIAFLFTAQYADEAGTPAAGERVFTDKACVQCHEVGGKGGHVGPGLDFLKRANAPILLAVAMWNHGPEMTEAMRARGIARPSLAAQDLTDLVAYVAAVARDGGREAPPVIPGTPGRGEKVFAVKHCVACHAVGGKGGHVGPALGARRHHLSLTGFAALMWNHGPAMWAKMRERGVEVPRLAGQEMADVVAYLYVSHYFDEAASAQRGEHVLQTIGCLACHSVRGKGGRIAGDFAKSNVAGSPATLLAGMWNNSRYMEAEARKQGRGLPVVTGQELADLSAYFTSLTKSTARDARSR